VLNRKNGVAYSNGGLYQPGRQIQTRTKKIWTLNYGPDLCFFIFRGIKIKMTAGVQAIIRDIHSFTRINY
jgi:hypothetical protein